MKETLYDRDESKLIERICQLRKIYPNLTVQLHERPLVIGGISDGVYSARVEYYQS
jgi:hypothetical protein